MVATGIELTWGLIVTAALLDSINPCVFGVLIFLIAFMKKAFRNPNKMLIGGLVYTTVVYLTYLLLGLGILKFTVSFGFSRIFYWIAALIAIGAGLLEIKDYFWYGKGFSLQLFPGTAHRIKLITQKIKLSEKRHPAVMFLMAVMLGIFVVLVELPCTGAPYLAILGLLSSPQYYVQGLTYLLVYNLVFILPLLIIIGLAYFGTSSKELEKWRKEHRGLMRLIIGLFLVALGAYMIYTVS
ncbi:TPA: hypothetical protein HA249_06740 [Candidatus Woesearchaeota archaeon]|nr:MAG: cytochrome c biogenesis transmembrane protein [archaeon GW2011_AR16]HIG96552.1 hypothetical protein [Candidatus Woesearchaeota archaeon]HII88788.1 hypothetical protein [Candidatus Woesearchaeota archaeon]